MTSRKVFLFALVVSLFSCPGVVGTEECAAAVVKSIESRGLMKSLLPSQDSIDACLSSYLTDAGVLPKFCLFHHLLPITSQIYAGAAFGLCLPANCDGDRVHRYVDAVCEVPMCSLLSSPSLRQLCNLLQPVYCDATDRWKAKSTGYVLQCVDVSGAFESDKRPRELHSSHGQEMAVSNNFDSSNRTGPSPILLRGEKRMLPPANADRSVSVAIPLSMMEALISCGSQTLENWETLLMSGQLQDPGEFERCRDAGWNYCLVKYFQMFSVGRCLPRNCDQDGLTRLLDYVCDRVGGDDEQKRWFGTCLELATVVPLDLCFTMSLLGCGRPLNLQDSITNAANEDAISGLLRSPDNQSGILRFSAGGTDPLLTQSDTHRYLEDNLPKLMRYVGDIANSAPPLFQSIVNWNPWMIDRREPHSSYFMYSNLTAAGETITRLTAAPATVHKTTAIRCDFSPPSKHSHDWWIYLSTLLGFLAVLPVLGTVGTQLLPVGCHLKKLAACLSPAHTLKLLCDNVQKLMSQCWSHACGIRFASMVWIIIGHVFAMNGNVGIISNFSGVRPLMGDFTFQVIISGQFSVDTFFLLSGFFMYISTKKFRVSKTVVNWSQRFKLLVGGIIRRWLRLTPAVVITMIIYYYGVQYWGEGPVYRDTEALTRTGIQGGCPKFWWATIFYVNDLDIGSPSLSMECLPHLWYLANDFQFFVVGLAVVLFTQDRPRPMFTILAGIMVASWISIVYVVIKYDLHLPLLSLSGTTNSSKDGFLPIFARLYVKPWCRIPPYLVGMTAAYLHDTRAWLHWFARREPPSPSLNDVPAGQPVSPLLITDFHSSGQPITVIPSDVAPLCDSTSIPHRADPMAVGVAHVLVAGTMWLLAFYLPYLANSTSASIWNRTFEVAYLAFSRSIWAVCVSWFILILAHTPNTGEPISSSNGGFIVDDQITVTLKKLLSLPVFGVCTFATYCGYLLHIAFEISYYASGSRAAPMLQGLGWFEGITFTAWTLGAGLVMYVFVEAPICRILQLYGLL